MIMQKTFFLCLASSLTLLMACSGAWVNPFQGSSGKTGDEIKGIEMASRHAMTKEYPGISPEAALNAAEKAIKSSDRRFEIISRQPDSFTATLGWTVFAGLAAYSASDTWRVSVKQASQGGARLTAQAWYSGDKSISGFSHPSSRPAGYDTGTRALSPWTSSGTEEDSYLSPPLYDLFHQRVAFALGQRNDWPPCQGLIETSRFVSSIGLQIGQDSLCRNQVSLGPGQTVP